MRYFPHYLLAFLFLCSGPFAFGAAGTEGAAFLGIPVGAGPASLGSAYSALANDAYAPIYNPAGLGFLNHPELSAQHLAYLQSMSYEFGSFVIPVPIKDSAVGTSIQYLGTGDIAATNPDGSSAGSVSAHYAAYTLSYGHKFTDSLSLGLSGKLIDAKLAEIAADAYAADVGALYEVSDRLALSAVLNNLGSKLTFTSQDDSLPMAFHLGAAYRFDSHLKTTVEGVYDKTGLLSGRVGMEWSPLEAISLRAGYRSDTVKDLSALAGFTTGIGIHAWGQELAYAWLPYGDLGDTQYFSLIVRFGALEDERKNMLRAETIKRNRETERPEANEYQQMMELLKQAETKDRTAQKADDPSKGIEQ